MEILETSAYVRVADQLLTDEEQRAPQNLLVQSPEAGDLIKGSGGLRKLRFGHGNRGKRAGVRAVYYHHDGRKVILLLVMYAKNRQDDLSDAQVAVLRTAIVREFK